MSVWSDTYQSFEGWTTWSHVLQQHQQLLYVGGQICKILSKNITGEPVGDPENPLQITSWDSDSTSSSPRKRIWATGDPTTLYPNPQSVRVFVDNTELTKTYNYKTITLNTEFYVEVQDNLVDYLDNVSIYLNRGFSTAAKEISYLYSTRAKSVNPFNLQPTQDTSSFRSLYSYTQYTDPKATFRGVAYPHTLLISFPPPPAFDTKFRNYGAGEEWINRVWTLGTPYNFKEFDMVYRVSDGRWYEVQDIEPNYIFYQDAWTLLTQSFTLTELAQTDIVKQFPLL